VVIVDEEEVMVKKKNGKRNEVGVPGEGGRQLSPSVSLGR
jgi:hypothetical protein